MFSKELREEATVDDGHSVTRAVRIFREEVSETRVIPSYGGGVHCQTSDWIKT